MVLAGAVVLAAATGCGRSESGARERYCAVVVATHDKAVTAYEQNRSGTPRSATAVPSIVAARRAVAPNELSLAWRAVVAGPGMESDGDGAGRKDDEFEAALTTIGDYDQRYCGVTPDLAPPDVVTVR